MGLLDRFRRPKETEAGRVDRLSRTGRVVEGRIIDINADLAGNTTTIFYRYEIAGVEYESAQTLTPEQQGRPAAFAPGARITIRYDPRQPANSVVI
jgi:Protein of unknown function (DUF3592)